MIPTSQNRAINHTGLRPRPQFEQIVDYLENGQERVKFPDREAKLIRNHPYMTQLDFFDMAEEEKEAWEQKKRKEEAKDAAEEMQTSEASVLASDQRDREAELSIPSTPPTPAQASTTQSISNFGRACELVRQTSTRQRLIPSKKKIGARRTKWLKQCLTV